MFIRKEFIYILIESVTQQGKSEGQGQRDLDALGRQEERQEKWRGQGPGRLDTVGWQEEQRRLDAGGSVTEGRRRGGRGNRREKYGLPK